MQNQNPTPSSTKTLKPSSLPPIKLPKFLEEVEYYNEAKTEFVRILLLGQSGAGKTHFIGTSPNPFVIDFDGGGKTLSKFHIPFKSFERKKRGTFKEVMEILLFMKDPIKTGPLKDVKTLAIDSLQALSDSIYCEAMIECGKDPNNSKADFDVWGKLKARMTSIMTELRDLKKHVICTAGVDISMNEIDGIQQVFPLMDGSVKKAINHMFDEVYYMKATGQGRDKYPKYELFTVPNGKFPGKSRTDGIQPRYESPSWKLLFGGAKK